MGGFGFLYKVFAAFLNFLENSILEVKGKMESEEMQEEEEEEEEEVEESEE